MRELQEELGLSLWGAARITKTSGCGKLHRNRRF